MEGFFCPAGSGLPVLSSRANEQDKVGTEQVQRRDRLALSFEHEIRSMGPRLPLPLIRALGQGEMLITCFLQDGSRAVAIARIDAREIHRDPG